MFEYRVADLTARVERQESVRTFVRYAQCFVEAQGSHRSAAERFQRRFPQSRHIEAVRKAAVGAGTTADSDWAAPLVGMPGLSVDFVEALRPMTVLGRMTGYRPVPFRTRVTRVTTGTSVGWVGESKPKPLSSAALDFDPVPLAKISGIVVVTRELAAASTPSAEMAFQADMMAAIAQFTDEQLLDPSVDELADVHPASITHGATEIESSGTDVDAVRADLISLFAAVETNLVAPYLVMQPKTAVRLGTLTGSGGNPVFPGLGARGGEILGVPVLTSASVPVTAGTGDDPDTSLIVLTDADALAVADEGIADLAISEHAALQASDSPTDGATAMVSLFQTNCLGLRIERMIRWQARRPNATAYISGFPLSLALGS